MSDISVNSRIAKNTLFLYCRMFVTVLVGLYTSRVVLQVLGVSDYGVYNVVGGVVSMLAFLNAAMVAASQRFISFELGRGNTSDIQTVFSTSFHIHLIIAVIVFLLAEGVGVWFVNTQLNIPYGRLEAANWVFQSSMIIFLLTIITVPYNSSVIAHEHMNVFALVSILEVCLKLFFVILLKHIGSDKLILYSLFMVLVCLISCTIYFIYSRLNFKECRRIQRPNKDKFKEMFSFAGWNIFGNIGSSFKEQCVSIVINIFGGTAVNAARGLAIQVNGSVNTFASNIVMAINPQITKQYASGDVVRSKRMVFACAKYSFFMLMLIVIPIIINIDYILSVWLVEVPEYSASFLTIILLVSIIYSLSAPISTALQATGKIKKFQIGVCLIMLVDIPAAYFILKSGYSPVIAVLPSLITNFVALIYRFYLIRSYVSEYSAREYYIGVVLRSLLVFICCVSICIPLSLMFNEGLYRLVFSSFLSIIIMGGIIYTLGLTKQEKQIGLSFVLLKINAFKNKTDR